MTRKRGKSVSFDAMIKFFMQTYQIPTKKDIEKVLIRMDRLEKIIEATAASLRIRRIPRHGGGREGALEGAGIPTASSRVLEIIRNAPEGVGIGEIQAITGFNEKKLRNIIFRLHKIGKITRKGRGIYVAIRMD